MKVGTIPKPEGINYARHKSEMADLPTAAFIALPLQGRTAAVLLFGQVFDKIKCKVSLFQECFLFILLKTANSIKRSNQEFSISLLSVCIMEITHNHVS